MGKPLYIAPRFSCRHGPSSSSAFPPPPKKTALKFGKTCGITVTTKAKAACPLEKGDGQGWRAHFLDNYRNMKDNWTHLGPTKWRHSLASLCQEQELAIFARAFVPMCAGCIRNNARIPPQTFFSPPPQRRYPGLRHPHVCACAEKKRREIMTYSRTE